ncbi:MAG: ABC transporter ATP-binding protein, partial [Desulfobacterales bacterium]|nr:ABC transporter ATP-binding protein [Desulfobacterales bacterium]
KNVCDRVAVMYLGKLCETAPTEDLFKAPAHPYSAALINAIPSPNPALAVVKVNLKSSEIPSPINPPAGCRFHTRCPNARALCSKTEPLLLDSTRGRQVACHYPLQIPSIQ